jgi:hypothetical protein
MDSSGANMTVVRPNESLGSAIAYSTNFGNNWTAKSIPSVSYAIGMALGDYITAPFASTFAFIGTQTTYSLYSPTNTFAIVYTQQYSYQTTNMAISKKAFKI